MVIGYARVSTEQQETEAQLPELRKAGCKRIYEETMGGGTMDRPELEKRQHLRDKCAFACIMLVKLVEAIA